MTIIESDNVTSTGGAKLDVMRDKDHRASLHKLSTEALVKDVVSGLSVDSRQNIVEE
jgi:hypothetical protein